MTDTHEPGAGVPASEVVGANQVENGVEEKPTFSFKANELYTYAEQHGIRLPSAIDELTRLIPIVDHSLRVEQARLLPHLDEAKAREVAFGIAIHHGMELFHAQGEIDRLVHALGTDNLTGLANRVALVKILDQYIAEPESNHEIGVMMIDGDGFKGINDTHGHLIGDVALQCMARTLRRLTKAGDVVARFGGDEFTILVTSEIGNNGAIKAAGRIQAGFRRSFRTISREFPELPSGISLGISTGLSVLLSDDRNSADIMRRADTNLYRAKAAGKSVAYDDFGRIELDDHGNIIGR